MRVRGLSWAVPFLLLAVLLVTGLAVRARVQRPGSEDVSPTAPKTIRTSPVTALGPLKKEQAGPARPTLPRGDRTPGPEELARSPAQQDFFKLFHGAKDRALAEIDTLIRSRGGKAALSQIRDGVQSAPSDLAGLLRAAFLARLIPYARHKDPSCAAEAVGLLRKLLAEPVDKLVRVQLLAGACGIESDNVTYSESTPGAPTAWAFLIGLPPGIPGDPYFASLAQDLAADPQVGSVALELARSGTMAAERILGVEALRRFPPLPEAMDVLKSAARSDVNPAVRQASVQTLIKIGGTDGTAFVLSSISDSTLQDFQRSEALAVLPRLMPYDRSIDDFFRARISDPASAGLRSTLVDVGFEYLTQNRGAEGLRDRLGEILRQDPGNEALLNSYVGHIREGGYTEFLPLFRSLQALASDPAQQQLLADASLQVERSGDFHRLSTQIDQVTAQLEALDREAASPATPAQRLAELQEMEQSLNQKLTQMLQDRAHLEQDP